MKKTQVSHRNTFGRTRENGRKPEKPNIKGITMIIMRI